MLKIKDNVDLKELEKYGFSLNPWNEYRKEICGGRRGQHFDLIVFGEREFYGKDRRIYGFAYGADGDGEEDFIDDTLYDLIKADLVEKVGDDNAAIDFLNNEVEILEEEKKIPEKIKDKYCSQISKVELAQKYNEIIDYLDYLKSKGE